MLHYDMINKFEGIDGSYKRIICYYWYFIDINFGFQPEACDGCHDLTQKVISMMLQFLKVIITEFVFGIWDDAINTMKNSNLIENLRCIYKKRTNKNKGKLQEHAWNRYHQQGGKEKVKEYYENIKERLKEQAQKYRELLS